MHVLLISRMSVFLIDASGQVASCPHAWVAHGRQDGAAQAGEAEGDAQVLGAWPGRPRGKWWAAPHRACWRCWGLPWVGRASDCEAAFGPASGPCLGARLAVALPGMHAGAESRSGWCRGSGRRGQCRLPWALSCDWAAAAWGWALTQ